MNKPLLSIFLGLCLTATLQANHIDFIADGGFLLTTSSTLGSASSTQTGDPGNIIGSEREVSLDFTTGTGFLTTGTLDVPAGPGPVGPDTSKVLLFDNSVSSAGTLTLTYDGVGSAGLGGLDFDTNWDTIDVTFNAVQGEGSLSLIAKDGSANMGTLAQTVNGAGTYSFSFADAAYAGVDFTDVDSLQFKLETTILASDFSITEITRQVVPEPTSTLLMIGAVLPFAFLRRRQR